MRLVSWAMAVAGLVAVACGGGQPVGPPIGPGGDPDVALTVREAIDSDLEGPLLVRGAVVAVQGQDIRLCDALAESFPPQCGGDSVVVKGLDLGTLEAVQTEGAVTRVEQARLLGTVESGVLTVETTAIAD